MTNKFMVRFNNYGEVLTVYTYASSPAQAKMFAAKRFSPMMGRSVSAVIARMKNAEVTLLEPTEGEKV